MQMYANARRRILSSSNPYHYSGSAFSGLGSPHTPPQYVWPLALMVQGLTSSDPNEQAALLRVLLRMQCGNGLMHESVHVSVIVWHCQERSRNKGCWHVSFCQAARFLGSRGAIHRGSRYFHAGAVESALLSESNATSEH